MQLTELESSKTYYYRAESCIEDYCIKSQVQNFYTANFSELFIEAEAPSLVNSKTFDVSGKTSAFADVVCYVNEVSQKGTKASSEGDFSCIDLSLIEGPNSIKIKAQDTIGQEIYKE